MGNTRPELTGQVLWHLLEPQRTDELCLFPQPTFSKALLVNALLDYLFRARCFLPGGGPGT